MNRVDAAKVLAVFGSAFRVNVDETTAEVWYSSCLHDCTPEVASEVVERIVAQEKWFPTVAHFHAIRRAIQRDKESPYEALPAPAVTVTERDRVKEIIAEARAGLRGEGKAAS